MMKIMVNIFQGYPKIFLKDMSASSYSPDPDDDKAVSSDKDKICILCQPSWENINTVIISIDDDEGFPETLRYDGTYHLQIPSGILVMQDDITMIGMAENTYMAIECQKGFADIKVYLDDCTNPAVIGLKISTSGGNYD